MSAPEPWEAQADESPRAFAAFVIYRDLPTHTRSHRLVAEQLVGESSGERRGRTFSGVLRQVERFSTKHAWAHRTRAWDHHCDERRCSAHLQAVEEMSHQHAAAATELLTTGLLALRVMETDAMKPSDIVKFISEAVRLERESRSALPTTVSDTFDPKESAQEDTRRLLGSGPEVVDAVADLLLAQGKLERAQRAAEERPSN